MNELSGVTLKYKSIFENAKDWVSVYSIKFVFAMIVLFVGLQIAKLIHKASVKSFRKMNMEITLITFLDSLLGISLKVVVFIIAANVLGIAFTSFVAIIGAASLAIGLSLQGSLSNFAGGVLILALKPFKVGDFIETDKHSGTVNEIRIFYTYLLTPDNKRIIIPNALLSNNSIINYSSNDTRRIDIKFVLASGTDISLTKEIAFRVISADERIMNEPYPFAGMTLQSPSAIHFDIRVWCVTDDYWNVYHDLLEKINSEFNMSGIRTASFTNLT